VNHKFKSEVVEGGVLLTLAIFVTDDEIKSTANKSDDHRIQYPRDLVKANKKSLEWLLHLLRLYVFFTRLAPDFITQIPTRKKKREPTRRRRERKV